MPHTEQAHIHSAGQVHPPPPSSKKNYLGLHTFLGVFVDVLDQPVLFLFQEHYAIKLYVNNMSNAGIRSHLLLKSILLVGGSTDHVFVGNCIIFSCGIINSVGRWKYLIPNKVWDLAENRILLV